MRTERISGHSTTGSSARDSQRLPGQGPSRLPPAPGGLTARRSVNVDAPRPQSSAPISSLASLPGELVSNIAARLPSDELKNLAATSSPLRTEVSPIRAASMRLSKVVHRVVTANRRAANEWSSLGFRRRFNPHQALADLGGALGHEQQAEAVAATVNELSPSEFAVLKDFVAKIPTTLWTNKKIDRDPQFQAIGLARAFFSRFKDHINADPLNEFALVVVELCKSAPALKHDHKLSTEAFRALKSVGRVATRFNVADYVLATAGTLGTVPAAAAFSALVSVPISTFRNMFKEDKTSSMALKFLVDVIGKIPQGQISDELHTQLREFLVGVTDETGQKVGRLAAVLNQKSTEEQRADLRSALLAAEMPTLASKLRA